MLNSPSADAGGYSNLFSVTDVNNLVRKDRSLLDKAIEVNGLLAEAHKFLDAYSRLAPLDKAKILSQVEVRAVMHIFNKKFPSRTSFESILHIAHEMYKEAKELDANLPLWNKVTSLAPATPVDGLNKIREVNLDGSFDDRLMESHGFKKDQLIINSDKHVYQITELCKNLKTIKCKLHEPEHDDVRPSQLELDRFDVIDRWKTHKVVATKFMTDIPNPVQSHGICVSVLQGVIKSTMMSQFRTSSEEHVVLQIAPDVKVVSKKNFKARSLKLVALTNSVLVTKVFEKSPSNHCLGTFGDEYKVWCRSSNVFPASKGEASSARSPFVSKFWSVQDSFDQSIVNAMFDYKDIEISLGTTKVKLQLPYIVSTKPIEEEEVIVVLRKSTSNTEEEEPPSKRLCIASAAGPSPLPSPRVRPRLGLRLRPSDCTHVQCACKLGILIASSCMCIYSTYNCISCVEVLTV